ncbi:transposase domain-containing protein [Bacillus sp. FJAT-45037]|uniref:transposase domain-containing protein n=1 Tax=Bacillus sp. FJAT-45037 TaxID=2011007 RepID=UPI001E46FBD1|nr:transposase domain-containing protein [Bacillus sp. FJAT-45037]
MKDLSFEERHQIRLEKSRFGLNPYQYILHLFEELPNIDISNENAIDQLLPWSNSLPEHCRIKQDK